MKSNNKREERDEVLFIYYYNLKMNENKLIEFRDSLRSVSDQLKSLQQQANEVAYAVGRIRTDLLTLPTIDVLPAADNNSPSNSATSPSIIDVDADDAQQPFPYKQRSMMMRQPTDLGK